MTFLGWDGPLLERAAQHLVEGLTGPLDLGDVLVAVPGARAGRQLQTHLAAAMRARGWAGFFPPRILTQGRLVDELVSLDRPVADRLTRTLTWEKALRTVDPKSLEPLVARRPEARDRGAWWALAEEVRGLHAELCVGGYDFAAVRDRLDQEGGTPPTELRRWNALAIVQSEWRGILDSLGMLDPHEGRRLAIDHGSVQRGAKVVLVGIVELGGLLRRALAALDQPAEVILFAPESLADRFDGFGDLLASRWRERHVPLDLSKWHVVDTPDDQARMAVAVCAGEGSLVESRDVVIGVPDEEVIPYLTRRLSSAGVRARDAAGTPFGRTAPATLLGALAEYLRSRSAEHLAALLRHGDLDRVLALSLDHDPCARFDAFREGYLPRRFEGDGTGLPNKARERDTAEPLLRAFGGIVGRLMDPEERPLGAIVQDVREFVDRVFGEHPFLADAEKATQNGEAARILRASLGSLAEAMAEIEAVPPSVAGSMAPDAGVGVLLRTATAGGAVPPMPNQDGEPTVELLGWLELLLDGASHIVVTGFTEGRVPDAPDGDSFLPDRLRQSLGLESDERRFARDLYTLEALLGSGRSVHVISGRKTRDGDPTFPSRLCFAVPEEDCVARLDHALDPARFAPVERPRDRAVEMPPVVQPRPAPEIFTVTAFADYLNSPALFHVRRQLRLRTVDDRRGELDALGFGNIAHDVLEAFGKSPLTASSDEGAIFKFLSERLDRYRKDRFPPAVMAAVPVQLSQLELRLRSFAALQARRVREGWAIREVEWMPEGKGPGGVRGMVPLDMGPGEEPAWIKGKIDRIDRRLSASTEWCVLDYKTSAKPKKCKEVYKVKGGEQIGQWKDLQLPLYAHLVRELTGDDVLPELGYVNLPGDGTAAEIELLSGQKWWNADALDVALDAARGVVRRIRAGELTDPGTLQHLAPIENELFGVGLVLVPESDSEDADGAQGGAQ